MRAMRKNSEFWDWVCFLDSGSPHNCFFSRWDIKGA